MKAACTLALVMLAVLLAGLPLAFAGGTGNDGGASTKAWASYEDMNRDFVSRFVASQGLGVARMAKSMMLDRSKMLVLGNDTYSLEELSLVGVARHDPPVVYAPLPHNDLFRVPEKRALNEFEQKALAELTAGKDIKIDRGGSAVLLVGAIRARQDCLKCHQNSKVGDVLGALTYKLKRL